MGNILSFDRGNLSYRYLNSNLFDAQFRILSFKKPQLLISSDNSIDIRQSSNVCFSWIFQISIPTSPSIPLPKSYTSSRGISGIWRRERSDYYALPGCSSQVCLIGLLLFVVTPRSRLLYCSFVCRAWPSSFQSILLRVPHLINFFSCEKIDRTLDYPFARYNLRDLSRFSVIRNSTSIEGLISAKQSM